MALIKTYKGLSPKWGRDCYFSENATLVGDVTLGDECSVWFNAVVRGDVAPITIGDRSNVTVHACTIHDGALIGMGATLLDDCEVGEWACGGIAEGRRGAERQLWQHRPDGGHHRERGEQERPLQDLRRLYGPRQEAALRPMGEEICGRE